MDTECSKIITKIKENYASLEKGIVNQLYFEAEHGATIGHYREKIWAEMFKRIVPKKFVVEQSVFLIDSRGKVSNEVDLAIFDELYTPYIFRYYDLKFIPLEAVAVVVECKSTSLNKENLESWAESISELKTSSDQRSFARLATKIAYGPVDTQQATRPLRVLCRLNERKKGLLTGAEKMFDVVIRALEEEERLEIVWDTEKKNLYDWYLCLNQANGLEKKIDEKEGERKAKKYNMSGYKVYKEDNDAHDKEELSLMSFNFQLNQILMLINNPMLFPHLDYVEMFNGSRRKEGSDSE